MDPKIGNYDKERQYLEAQIENLTSTGLDQLFKIWTELGFEDIQRDRGEAVLHHLKTAFTQMIKEDLESLDKVRESIMELTKEKGLLCQEMEMDSIGGSDHDERNEDKCSLSLIDTEYKLRRDVEELRKAKAERVQAFHHLRLREADLCSALGSSPCEMIDLVPYKDQLQRLQKHIHSLESLRATRSQQLEQLSSEIRKLLAELDITEPRNSGEREIVSTPIEAMPMMTEEAIRSAQVLLENLAQEKNDNVELARGLLHKIRDLASKLGLQDPFQDVQEPPCSIPKVNELQMELKRLQAEKKKHMQVFIEAAQRDLDQLWQKCFASQDEKAAFYDDLEAFIDDPESTLELYESHVRHWESYFDRHRGLLAKMQELFKLWEDRVFLDVNASDPSRLRDFRALREEEKMRNRVNKRLPKLVEQIQNEINDGFLIEGKTFAEVCKLQETQHALKVHMQKEERRKKVQEEASSSLQQQELRGRCVSSSSASSTSRRPKTTATRGPTGKASSSSSMQNRAKKNASYANDDCRIKHSSLLHY